MTIREWKCCTAELLGTFALVFFGCGAIALLGKEGGLAGHLTINLVFGAVVAAMIFSLGHISCAHFNPAVTVGFAIARRFPWRLVGAYILFQLAGAVLACCALALLLPSAPLSAAHFGGTVPGLGMELVAVLGVELLISFFLMLVIISVATDARVPPGFAAIAIGAWVTMAGLMAGPLSGSSMNPARSFGPAAFAGGPALAALWLYFAGPVVGASLGALVYEFLRSSRGSARTTPDSCCAAD